MPTYEYRCEKCGHELEEFQSITAKPLRKCPACGKAGLKRCISTGAGVIFKGTGFWQTDYRSESYKKGAEADKKSGEAKEAKSDTKTDSASPAKSESKADTKKSAKKSAGGKSKSAMKKSE